MSDEVPLSDRVPPPGRKIIHIDMDAFFASVEQRDNPALRGRPVAVGGSQRRGVVAAASYEARKFGVCSAMPSVTAARHCPELVFVPARFEVYREVSRQIRDIFHAYSDLVEPLSLDEAYLDVTADKRAVGSAMHTARDIRAEIKRVTGLTASAGISYNKFLAKIASDQNKPDGMFVIRPRDGEAFVASLPVRRFYGVGPRTAQKMARLGIETGQDLREHDMEFLVENFGSYAQYLYQAARGIDHRQVRPNRVRKSVGRERTYADDLVAEPDLRQALDEIVDSVWRRIEDNEAVGRTVTLKVKYADFNQITRSQSSHEPVPDREAFAAIGHELLGQLLPVPQGVRLLGLSLSGLVSRDSGEVGIKDTGAIAEQGEFDF